MLPLNLISVNDTAVIETSKSNAVENEYDRLLAMQLANEDTADLDEMVQAFEKPSNTVENNFGMFDNYSNSYNTFTGGRCNSSFLSFLNTVKDRQQFGNVFFFTEHCKCNGFTMGNTWMSYFSLVAQV